MKTEWDNVQFTFVAYRETGVSILSAVDDIQVCSPAKITSNIVVFTFLLSLSVRFAGIAYFAFVKHIVYVINRK